VLGGRSNRGPENQQQTKGNTVLVRGSDANRRLSWQKKLIKPHAEINEGETTAPSPNRKGRYNTCGFYAGLWGPLKTKGKSKREEIEDDQVWSWGKQR